MRRTVSPGRRIGVRAALPEEMHQIKHGAYPANPWCSPTQDAASEPDDDGQPDQHEDEHADQSHDGHDRDGRGACPLAWDDGYGFGK
jgi:hypothetical protein